MHECSTCPIGIISGHDIYHSLIQLVRIKFEWESATIIHVKIRFAMKNIIVVSFILSIALHPCICISAQDYASIFVPSSEGIRAAEFTGLVEVSGGFIATGHIDTFYNGAFGTGRIWAAKVSTDGTVIWTRFFRDVNPSQSWWGRKAANADEDGVYILGDYQAHSGFILKLDKNGQMVWKTNTIVTPNNSWANDLISTPDGGCLAVGYTQSSDTAAYVKLDKNGGILFTGKYKPESDHSLRFCSVDKAFDGGYYIAGIQREFIPKWKERFLVVKISEGGQFLWRKTLHGGSFAEGDQKQSNAYSISALPNGGFVAGGLVYKENIINQQAFLMRGDDYGDTLWTKTLFEELYPFPGNGADNIVDKVVVKNDIVYAEFVESDGSSTAKNFLVSLDVLDGQVNWKQTGYKLSDQHSRNFSRVLQSGQPCFIGGEFYIDYPKHGLILTTTSDGLWIPPTIDKFEGGVDQPEVITHVTAHINVKRILQVSRDADFSTIAYEQSDITKDTVHLDLSSLEDGKYYLRAGIIGGLGNTIWSEGMEIFMFSTLSLRYAVQVTAYSTQYGGGWSASEVTGPPNVYPSYGDHTGTWASSTADGQREYLECTYSNPDKIAGIVIFETFNPGAVDTVYVRNPNSQQWEVVYSATAYPAPAISRALAITIPETSFSVSAVRVAFNSPAVPGYNEVDAIGLVLATGVPTSDIQKSTPGIKISPNPANNRITVLWNIPLSSGCSYFVSDLNGRNLLSGDAAQGMTGCDIDISSLPTGSYIVTLGHNGVYRAGPFIKE